MNAENAYMASPDDQHPIAYLDVSDLFALTLDREYEPIFAATLPPRRRWEGIVDTLKPIRHRIAHCRRPHSDDLPRLLQTLRDLELGAASAWRSYALAQHPGQQRRDPLLKAWIKRRHEAADRLIDHARRQYETSFQLSYSVRPWAQNPGERARLSGRPGCIWHAEWTLRGGHLEPDELWRALDGSPDSKLQLVHLLLPYSAHIRATFAAVDDPDVTADAIGAFFEAVLTSQKPLELVDRDTYRRWPRHAEALDPRIHAGDLFANVDPYGDLNVFGA
jgi:hypothetical protein